MALLSPCVLGVQPRLLLELRLIETEWLDIDGAVPSRKYFLEVLHSVTSLLLALNLGDNTVQ